MLQKFTTLCTYYAYCYHHIMLIIMPMMHITMTICSYYDYDHAYYANDYDYIMHIIMPTMRILMHTMHITMTI